MAPTNAAITVDSARFKIKNMLRFFNELVSYNSQNRKQ